MEIRQLNNPGGEGEMKVKRLINPKWFSSDIPNLEDQVLMANSCPGCGKIYFPPQRVCPACMTMDQMDRRPLSKRGRLYSFTVSYAGPPGFELPYAYGWVDLPEGIRLFSLLTQCEPFEDRLQLDIPVEMVIEKIKEDPEGTEIYGYKFRPV